MCRIIVGDKDDNQNIHFRSSTRWDFAGGFDDDWILCDEWSHQQDWWKDG